MSTSETMSQTCDRLSGVLSGIVDGLRDGVAQTAVDHEAHGYVETHDPAFVAASVRRFLRQRLTAAFPSLAHENGNMSPIHLDLGRDQLKVLHAREGEMPQAQSEARRLFYGVNDAGQLAFDLDGDSTEGVECQALVLAWDSAGTDLTQATLFKPSLDHAAQHIDLLSEESQEEDIAIELSAEEEDAAVGDANEQRDR